VLRKQKTGGSMKQNNCINKSCKYTHLKESDRYKIEVWLEDKKTVQEIAKILGRARSDERQLEFPKGNNNCKIFKSNKGGLNGYRSTGKEIVYVHQEC
jgi:IS30 family transposase